MPRNFVIVTLSIASSHFNPHLVEGIISSDLVQARVIGTQ